MSHPKLKHSDTSASCEPTDSDWRDEVKNFITTNYNVHDVTSVEIAILFNGHRFGISYQSIRHTFARKKDIRPPTRTMR